MTFKESYSILIEAARHSFAAVPIIRISEAIRLIKGIEETYAKPVEMTQKQSKSFKTLKASGDSFSQAMFEDYRDDSGYSEVGLIDEFYWFLEQDLMRAWLHPELIVVVE